MDTTSIPKVEGASIELTAEKQLAVVGESAGLLEALDQYVASESERLWKLDDDVRIGRRTEA